jgi:hypothetical protein
LRQHKVRLLTPLDFLCIYSFIFFTDAHNTWPRIWRNRYSRRRTSCECIAAEHGEIVHTIWLHMHLFIHQFSQTLTTLDLKDNEIGDQGAEHLANALHQNKVILLTPLDYLYIYSFIILHRHSQHLISRATKSVLKAPNILRMHCSKTRWDCSQHSTSYGSIPSSFSTDAHNAGPQR